MRYIYNKSCSINVDNWDDFLIKNNPEYLYLFKIEISLFEIEISLILIEISLLKLEISLFKIEISLFIQK